MALDVKRLEEKEALEKEFAERRRESQIAQLEIDLGIDDSTAERFLEMAEQGANAAESIRSSFANALLDVGDNFANTFADAIIQGDSLSQALRGVAQAFLTDVLSSLIKVGARMLVNAAIGKSIEASATAASVAAAAVTASAWAPAAALVSLATFGSNAAAANAGIASTFALSTGLASVPGLALGGPIGAGSMRRVNESGPELFTDGARQFLIPDKAGKVVSNSDAKGGGNGGVNINFNVVNNSKGAGFEVESINSTDTEITINAIVADITTGNGPVSKALFNSTNVTSKANG